MVLWQGSAGDRRPYADLTAYSLKCNLLILRKSPSRNGIPFGDSVADCWWKGLFSIVMRETGRWFGA